MSERRIRLNQLAEGFQIDVAATENDSRARARDRDDLFEDRRGRQSPRRFHDNFHPLGEKRHRPFNGVVRYRDHIIDVVADDRKSMLAQGGRSRSIRDGGRMMDRLEGSGAERPAGVVRALRFHADDLAARAEQGGGQSASRQQAAPATGNQEKIEIPRVLEQLQRRCSLSRNDMRVIVGGITGRARSRAIFSVNASRATFCGS